MSTIKPSLIIATYNWPEALDLVLQSVEQQSLLPYEVLIADDGSTSETKQVIDKYKEHGILNIHHIWHEDKGFRLSEIRNKAIDKANGNYIIQIDGDTFLHKDFVKDHVLHARSGQFISGSRVLLAQKLSKHLLDTQSLVFNRFDNDIKNKHYQFHLPFITRLLKKPTKNVEKVIRSVRGCNMSFWKKDLLKVNGYNEKLVGWGREDSEISARLVHLGLKKINLKFSAIQYHLYHKEASKDQLIKNHTSLMETIKKKKTITEYGIKKINSQQEGLPISAIILTLNEEENISAAIENLDFVNEIIVVDSFSSDKTPELAKSKNVRFYPHKFIDFSSQKAFAISKTKNKWILFLDADERLSDELIEEIKSNILYPDQDIKGYWIKRQNFFKKKRIRFSGWQNDKVLRLFHKDFCKPNGKWVHEGIQCEGKTKILKSPLYHYTFKDKTEYKLKILFYAKLKAFEYYKNGMKPGYYHLYLKPLYRFFFHYFYRLGFLDGKAGFIISSINAKGMYWRYKFLKKLYKKEKK